MSYNITSVSIKKIKTSVTGEHIAKFMSDLVFGANGGEIIINIERRDEITIEQNQDGTKIVFCKENDSYYIKSFGFSSSFDPSDFRELIHDLIRDTNGELEVLYVWEGGDSVEEVSISNKEIKNKILT